VLVMARRLGRTYQRGSGEPVHALREVDLEVAPGELVFVVGPSGSGKSTLLHLLGALDRPTTGELQVAGVDLGALSDGAASRFRGETVGFIFQSHHLLPGLSALENTLVPLVPQGLTPEHRGRALRLLEELGLEDRLHHRPASLSGGECQRVAIARALIRSPRLLLADEPTGELDRRTGDRVVGILREHLGGASGRSALVVTHDHRLIRPGDRLLEIEDGRIAPGGGAVPVEARTDG
jgi:putative ABC transport system ATP-binding protein